MKIVSDERKNRSGRRRCAGRSRRKGSRLCHWPDIIKKKIKKGSISLPFLLETTAVVSVAAAAQQQKDDPDVVTAAAIIAGEWRTIISTAAAQ